MKTIINIKPGEKESISKAYKALKEFFESTPTEILDRLPSDVDSDDFERCLDVMGAVYEVVFEEDIDSDD